jgi:hypothetical protein
LHVIGAEGTQRRARSPIGILIFDLFDSKAKKLIWRGMVSDALLDKPEEKALTEMFKCFPPPPTN